MSLIITEVDQNDGMFTRTVSFNICLGFQMPGFTLVGHGPGYLGHGLCFLALCLAVSTSGFPFVITIWRFTFSVQIAFSSIPLMAVIGITVYLRTRTGLNARDEGVDPKYPGNQRSLGQLWDVEAHLWEPWHVA